MPNVVNYKEQSECVMNFVLFFFSWDQTPPAKRLRNIEKGKWEIFVLADVEAFTVATLQVVNQF